MGAFWITCTVFHLDFHAVINDPFSGSNDSIRALENINILTPTLLADYWPFGQACQRIIERSCGAVRVGLNCLLTPIHVSFKGGRLARAVAK
jgi:hypothetical protein